MPENDKLSDAMKWGGGFFTLLVSYAVLWMFVAQTTENATFTKLNSFAYTAASDDIERFCIAKPRNELSDCIAQSIKSSAEEKRAQHDLIAQRDMAQWAMWMVVVSAIGSIISGVGIVVVWQTISLNRDAVKVAIASNKIAREIGEAQARAYVSIYKVKFHPWPFNGRIAEKKGEGLEFGIRLEFDNAGQTPAHNIMFSCAFTVYQNNLTICKTEKSDFCVATYSLGVGQKTDSKSYTVINYPANKLIPPCLPDQDVIGTNHTGVIAVVEVTYEDVFGKVWCLEGVFDGNMYKNPAKQVFLEFELKPQNRLTKLTESKK